MRIKLSILITITIFIYNQNVKAQNYYAGLSVGYGRLAITNTYALSTSAKNELFWMGDWGCVFSEKSSVEINFTYTSSNEKGTDGFVYSSSSTKIFQVIPTFKYKLKKSFSSVYLKAGFHLGIGPSYSFETLTYNDVAPFDTSFISAQYSGGVAPGYLISLGKDFKLNQEKSYKLFSLFIEGIIVNSFWKPKEFKVLENKGSSYTLGKDQYDFSTVGILVGLKYNFW